MDLSLCNWTLNGNTWIHLLGFQARRSERIRQKQSRVFHQPTREEEWSKILPTKSPEKYMHLKPRKLVNNFTRENHRYNCDPYETSGDESMDDFIADSDDKSDSSSETFPSNLPYQNV